MDLDQLMDRFRGPLIGLFASMGANWGEAEDLARTVFTEAWLGRARFRGDFERDQDVGAWLRGIARNLWRESLRDRERRAAVPLDSNDVTDALPAANPVSEAEPSILIELLPLLGTKFATILRLRYFEDSSVSEVAGLLEISEKAAVDQLYRARKALKELLVEREA
ncbi:MAG: RNA polymerase sigma factor (sigma-70 family) [Planctomycetota bacterium]|jgi:RNA polymerase sigma factor (sigma-70 family)